MRSRQLWSPPLNYLQAKTLFQSLNSPYGTQRYLMPIMLCTSTTIIIVMQRLSILPTRIIGPSLAHHKSRWSRKARCDLNGHLFWRQSTATLLLLSATLRPTAYALVLQAPNLSGSSRSRSAQPMRLPTSRIKADRQVASIFQRGSYLEIRTSQDSNRFGADSLHGIHRRMLWRQNRWVTGTKLRFR